VMVDAAAVPGTMSTNATTLDNRNFLKANLPLSALRLTLRGPVGRSKRGNP
jgi:hypothetical protein